MMQNLTFFLTALVLTVSILTGLSFILYNDYGVPTRQFVSATRMALYDMQLSSSAFSMNGPIPQEFTCDGDERTPPLTISGVPSEAKSLALVMYDPDVPRDIRSDGNWDHWLVWNMPPSLTELFAGERPEGVEGTGTGGVVGYQGPCPPDREHRYFFILYALDTMLDLPEGASRAELEDAMKGHVITQAELIGKYERTKR
jgi:Raf kinase inhibitor-like YbhB/YbcL family protein